MSSRSCQDFHDIKTAVARAVRVRVAWKRGDSWTLLQDFFLSSYGDCKWESVASTCFSFSIPEMSKSFQFNCCWEINRPFWWRPILKLRTSLQAPRPLTINWLESPSFTIRMTHRSLITSISSTKTIIWTGGSLSVLMNIASFTAERRKLIFFRSSANFLYHNFSAWRKSYWYICNLAVTHVASETLSTVGSST